MSELFEYECQCCGQQNWGETFSINEHEEHGLCKLCFENPLVRVCDVIVEGKVEEEVTVNLKDDGSLREALKTRFRGKKITINPVGYVLDIIGEVTDYIQNDNNTFYGHPL